MVFICSFRTVCGQCEELKLPHSDTYQKQNKLVICSHVRQITQLFSSELMGVSHSVNIGLNSVVLQPLCASGIKKKQKERNVVNKLCY